MRAHRGLADGRDSWITEAETGAEGELLARRAAILRELRHPGIVDLRACDGGGADGRLVTAWVGPSLGAFRAQLGPSEVAGIGAAVATTVADLHALGWAHGSVRADHVLIDRAGRPVLCGISGAFAPAGPADCSRDTAAIIGVLEALLPEGHSLPPSHALRRALQPRRHQTDPVGLAERLSAPKLAPALPVDAAANRDSSPGAGPSVAASHGPAAGPSSNGAARLTSAQTRAGAPPGPRRVRARLDEAGALDPAGALDEAGGAARSPGVEGDGRLLGRRRFATRRTVAGAVAAAVSGAMLWVGAVGLAPPSSNAAARCPAVDMGCGPLPARGGVVTVAVGRFGIGEPGDVIVLGRWACGPVALPAVLRPRPGSVWVFDRWPAAGLDVAARPVGEVGGAVSLTVVPGTSGCDHIEVRRGAGSSEMIDPAAPR